ncbi:GDP-mannose 4,6 dehydratase domain-containing protein [Phthorimaea operculella]|nr:GDP-mannose 4,6 dehydratase domain-containing protein [Phthorimaea operculella]
MKPENGRKTTAMPSILVTGGAGYVGSHTVITLLERHPDAKIVVVDNLSNAYRAAGQKKPEPLRIIEELTNKTIEFYEVDIRDKEALSKIFEHNNIECVIHFAALKAVGESVQKPLEYYQANISGTCTLFEVMRNFGVYKLVYSSSCTVYGEPEYLPLNEGHPTGRGLTSPYGKSKYFCEEIMKDLCRSDPKWQIVSLRYFNPVGAHHSGRIGEDPTGIPNNLMPFISQVADLAEGHVKAVKLFHQPGFSGFHAVNLGTGTGYSVLQMVSAFERVSGRAVPYKVVGRRAGDIAANYADVSLAQRLLGWRATRTLDDMCADTWRWQSAHPQGFHN